MYRRAAPRTDPALPRRTARGGAGPGRRRLPIVCAGTGRTRHRGTGPGVEAGVGSRRGGDGRRPVGGRLRRLRVASGPADALDRPRDPARRRRLSRSGRRHQSARRRPAGSVPTGLVVPHDVQRTGRALELHAAVPRDQLPRRDLAQRPTAGRQQPHRRHVRRPRSRRHPVDPRRAAEHLGGQGHSGAGATGRRRRRTRRQLVRLDQLARDRLPGPRGQPGPRHVLRARPQRRHLETGLPAN